MKLNKEIRQLSRKMLQASFTDGQLDPGRIASLVDSVMAEKPRNYIDVLKNYKRLLRLEVEKRHATIETARAELLTKRGPNFKYETALGTQAPQLDYRKGSVP